jgi:hypothetical protein
MQTTFRCRQRQSPACKKSYAFLLLVVIATSASPRSASAVTVNQSDDFEDSTLQSWEAGGGSNPNPPTNISTGGPAGAGDQFLRLTSSGSSGAGGRLVVFNGDQWTGDYLAESIDSIRMQVRNLGATNLVLRLILENANAGDSLGTISPVNVPAGGGWTTVSFSLASANLMGGDYTSVMEDVTTLNLVHSPSAITARSSAPNIAAQLGVDNITAVPEPSGIAMALAGWTLLTTMVVRRRAKSRL